MRGPLRAYQATGLQRLVRRSGLLERTWPRLAVMSDLAPPLTRRERLPERVPAVGTRRAVVGLLTGCVQGEFFPGVNAATARVLAAEGCDVIVPPAHGGWGGRPRAGAGAAGCTTAASPRRSATPGAPSTPARPRTSTRWWSTRPGAGR